MLEKISSFASGKGFYIILALCAAAIGVSGYVLFFTGNGQEPITAEVIPPPVVEAPRPVVPDAPVIKKEPVIEQKKEEPKPAPKAAPAAKKEAEIPAKAAEAAAPLVAGEFIGPVADKQPARVFTAGNLAFDETMGDWRVHTGTDFNGGAGDQVCAIGDGTVKAVFVDELAGTCVTIDHGNEIISTVRGLMKNATVKEGASIKMGDVIGGIGTMPSESKQAPHVHLEVEKKGKLVDPVGLFE